MKKEDVTENTGPPVDQRHNSQEYPDVIASEEPEEENPNAYTLLSKIEDPYYTKNEHSERTKSSFNEGNINNSIS